MNSPFNLIVTAKTSAPEQFERPPFWKPSWRLGRIAWRHCAHERNARIWRRQMQKFKMVECPVVGSSNRTPTDSKRGISFYRLPLKNKPFLKEWLVRIKRANLPSATSVRSTLRRSVSKVAVTSTSGPEENVNASWTKTLSRQYFRISKRKAEGLQVNK